MIRILLLDLLLIGLIALLGALVAWMLLDVKNRIGIVALAFPLGAGFLSWFLFLLSWIGLRITISSIIGLYFSLLMIVLALGFSFRRLRIRRNMELPKAKERGRIWKIGFAISLAGLFALSAFLAIGRSYSSWDAIAIWSIKGYGIAREGTIFAGQQWGAHGLSYPLNIPLLVSVFRLFSGDILPGSKLIFPLFYTSLIMGCFSFWRNFQISKLIASLGALLVASIPIVFEHGTIGYANLPFTSYLVLGCLLIIEGTLSKEKDMQVAGGILMGFACWSRQEGLFLVPILAMALLIALWLSKRLDISISIWLIPIAFIGVIWLIFLGNYGRGDQLSLGITSIKQHIISGTFPWSILPKLLRYLIRQTFTFKIWGLLYPTVILIVIMNFRKLHITRYAEILTTTAVMVGAAAAMMIFSIIISIMGELDIWISSGIDRMFLPVGVFVAVWAVLLAGTPNRVPSSSSSSIRQLSLIL
jgi:hypothetical protein